MSWWTNGEILLWEKQERHRGILKKCKPLTWSKVSDLFLCSLPPSLTWLGLVFSLCIILFRKYFSVAWIKAKIWSVPWVSVLGFHLGFTPRLPGESNLRSGVQDELDLVRIRVGDVARIPCCFHTLWCFSYY